MTLNEMIRLTIQAITSNYGIAAFQIYAVLSKGLKPPIITNTDGVQREDSMEGSPVQFEVHSLDLSSNKAGNKGRVVTGVVARFFQHGTRSLAFTVWVCFEVLVRSRHTFGTALSLFTKSPWRTMRSRSRCDFG